MEYKQKCISAMIIMVATTFVVAHGGEMPPAYNNDEAERVVLCDPTYSESVDQIKSIFKSASITPLEQSKPSVSSNCEIIEFNEEYLLINKQSHSLVRFDKNGRYKNRIGEWGRAHNGGIEITNVQIDGDDILIYSNTNSTLYRYSIDGDSLGSVDTGIRAEQLLKVEEGYYAYFGYSNGQQKERILAYDKTFTKSAQYLPTDAKLAPFMEPVDPLTIQNSDIYIRETYNRFIHKISNNGELSTPIEFDFQSYNIPPECFVEENSTKAGEIMLSNDFASILNFEKVGDYSLVQIIYQMTKGGIYNILGVKHNSDDYRWITTTPSGSNVILFLPTIHISDSGVVTALVDRSAVESFNSKSIGFIDNIDLLQSVDGDNPVVIKFKLK